jgi:hypothetical protein
LARCTGLRRSSKEGWGRCRPPEGGYQVVPPAGEISRWQLGFHIVGFVLGARNHAPYICSLW